MFNELNGEFFSTINETVEMAKKEVDGQLVNIYKNLKDYVGKEVSVCGYYIRDSKYGKQVTVQNSDDGCFVNLPKYMTKDFEGFTLEQKKAVLNGELVLKDIKTKTSKTYGSEMCVCTYGDKKPAGAAIIRC